MLKPTQRRVAYDVLLEVERGAYANLALKNALPSLPDRERAFCSALVYGVLEKKLLLDFVVSKYAKKPAKPAIATLLRMGVYQLLYMNVPPSAAVNESVKLAKELGKGTVAGFVNGLLRSVAREKEALVPPSGVDAESLSLRHSWPLWIAERFYDRFGGEEADALLTACERPDCATPVRAVTGKAKAALTASNHRRGAFCDDVFYVEGDVASSELFTNGDATVQSEGSALICRVCDAKEGDAVLDACAAPGGKTALLAQTAGSVTAWDVHPHRVDLIKSTCARLHVQNVSAAVRDAAIPVPELYGAFDMVLVDAPCSGLGVTAGKPDLKYGKTPETVASLAALQRKILCACANYVKTGGALVYSTCTISKEENEDVTDAFLADHTEFYPDDISRFMPEDFNKERVVGGRVQLLPHIDGVDGFYFCRMVKKAHK